MKNQTKRVEDAISTATRGQKRQRIERLKEPTPEERERAKIAKLMRVDMTVWDIVHKSKLASAKREQQAMGDLLNSPYKTERERLIYNKQRYANMSISEAFSEHYGMALPDTGNDVPVELGVGDIVNLSILSISKKSGVQFNAGSYKENFITRNNLAHYSKFSKVRPIEPLKARVVEVGKKATVVDLYGPMIEDFVLPRAKTPWSQNRLDKVIPIRVKNLQLVRGGYIGQAVIPNISEFVGEDFTIDAFIPGSQIVLNTTDDFGQFEGATVQAFVLSYAPKPNDRGMSLVCSVKTYLKHLGHLELKELHSAWCDAGQDWENISAARYEGIVTGVLNSSKKCGVFVELPGHNITGMIPMEPEQLVEYKAGDQVNIRFKTFEEELTYNAQVDQMQRVPAFEIENEAIRRVNIKPIFELA